MVKFYNVDIKEQESIINVNYAEKTTTVYTCKFNTYKRLLLKLGNPSKIYYTNKKISGASWIIPFEDKKRSNYIFSRPTIIGNVKSNNNILDSGGASKG